MKRIIFFPPVLLVAAFGSSAAQTTDDHVAGVRQIGALLAEYTRATGGTPFIERWEEDDPDDDTVPVTIICNLSENEIPDELAFPPFSCFLMEVAELEAYLSAGIGREIRLPLDDRELVHRGRPMPWFYTVQIGEGNFFVATYLAEAHEDARRLGEGFYKFEVGSVAVPERKIEKALAPGEPKR